MNLPYHVAYHGSHRLCRVASTSQANELLVSGGRGGEGGRGGRDGEGVEACGNPCLAAWQPGTQTLLQGANHTLVKLMASLP